MCMCAFTILNDEVFAVVVVLFMMLLVLRRMDYIFIIRQVAPVFREGLNEISVDIIRWVHPRIQKIITLVGDCVPETLGWLGRWGNIAACC